MSESLRGSCAIVGTGLSRLGEVPGWTQLELLAVAVKNALDDAGLEKNAIDGVFTVIDGAPLPVPAVCEYLGLNPKVQEGTMLGGASFGNSLLWAALALQSGQCNVALIAYGSNARSGKRRIGGHDPIPYEGIYAPQLPIFYALAAARHMEEYGTTREQFAEVAVAARRWAHLNPAASRRDIIEISDVLNSRMLCDPLTVLDCCLISDGAGAVIMTRSDRAPNHSEKPVYLLGVASEHSHQQIAQMPDLTVTAAARSGPRAFEMAGYGPPDVDALMLYDAFTINPILFLEDLGFCEKGEGGAFVSGGRIAPGGSLPVNTNGGGLSCVHPGMYGIFTIIEAATQIRDRAGERQLPNTSIVLTQGSGGSLSSQVTAIFGEASTL